jgi:hypothetical protein
MMMDFEITRVPKEKVVVTAWVGVKSRLTLSKLEAVGKKLPSASLIQQGLK